MGIPPPIIAENIVGRSEINLGAGLSARAVAGLCTMHLFRLRRFATSTAEAERVLPRNSEAPIPMRRQFIGLVIRADAGNEIVCADLPIAVCIILDNYKNEIGGLI